MSQPRPEPTSESLSAPSVHVQGNTKRRARGLLVVASLALSGAAFAAVARVEAPRETPPRETAVRDVAVETSKPPLVARALPPVTSSPSTEVTAPVKEAAAPRMPDFKGKRLSAVRKDARRLGLRVAARDDSGMRVMAEESSFYRVRRQTVAAGEPLPPSGLLEVVARATGDAVEGY